MKVHCNTYLVYGLPNAYISLKTAQLGRAHSTNVTAKFEIAALALLDL